MKNKQSYRVAETILMEHSYTLVTKWFLISIMIHDVSKSLDRIPEKIIKNLYVNEHKGYSPSQMIIKSS